ncbi:hypothetical protein A2U01_0102050, partial [Trifolium medium]|nr:hypothetical protein [Trifolium medium]
LPLSSSFSIRPPPPPLTLTTHPPSLPLFCPDLPRRDVASPSSGAIDLGVATPPCFHP